MSPPFVARLREILRQLPGRWVAPRGAAGLLALSALLTAVVGCSTIDRKSPKKETHLLPPAEAGPLATLSRQVSRRFGDARSGFLLLASNQSAFEARLALADQATRSIDAQYFIWSDDHAGRILLNRLFLAAERGVRVRLLVDDFTLKGNDRAIAALSAHPNFDIRLFNPNALRRGTIGPLVEFLVDFRELNRRMHNKLFIVDGRAAVVGGRNIGDAYFGLSEGYNFRDLGVLAAGPVVGEIASAFDEYWNSGPAVPGERLAPDAGSADLDALVENTRAETERRRDFLRQTPYPAEPRDWSDWLAAVPGRMHGGVAHFVQDEPLVDGTDGRQLTTAMTLMGEGLESEILVVSPYLIPPEGLIRSFEEAEARGVDVRVLTASLPSNNHTATYSHYRKYRRPLLATGADVFEFMAQPSPAMRSITDVPPIEADFISLHVKAFVADRRRVFIGSLNLDPRAIAINTENGLIIDSPGLGAEVGELIDRMCAPDNAWQLTLGKDGRFRWVSADGVRRTQPARGPGQRVLDFLLGLLPIEGQL